jgi:NAD(P)-dependent dehydrogenase (short-subunit alcohol dehydrogenase family)
VEGKGIVNTGGASGLGLATVETRIAVIDPVKEVLRMRARDLA